MGGGGGGGGGGTGGLQVFFLKLGMKVAILLLKTHGAHDTNCRDDDQAKK